MRRQLVLSRFEQFFEKGVCKKWDYKWDEKCVWGFLNGVINHKWDFLGGGLDGTRCDQNGLLNGVFWECGGQKGGLFSERRQQDRKMRKLGMGIGKKW